MLPTVTVNLEEFSLFSRATCCTGQQQRTTKLSSLWREKCWKVVCWRREKWKKEIFLWLSWFIHHLRSSFTLRWFANWLWCWISKFKDAYAVWWTVLKCTSLQKKKKKMNCPVMETVDHVAYSTIVYSSHIVL